MKTSLLTLAAVAVLGLLTFSGWFLPAQPETQTAGARVADREYTLEASILGYRGVGGAIDGIRNPLLQAAKGETVQITIINAEPMTHDIALQKHDAKSKTLVETGDRDVITFVAQESDIYFCTIPGHRAAGMEGKFQILEDVGPVIAGFPAVKNGRPVNLNFEDGTLTDWTVEGTGFTPEPINGDVVVVRTGDTRSGHEGQYWVSSGEVVGHRALGQMTSTTFSVNHPYASFLVAGGALADTRVELVRASNNEVIFKTNGADHSTLRPVVVDLRPYQGQDIYIRLIDDETGISEIPYVSDQRFAFISFDDFKFYDSRPIFPNEFNPADVFIMPPMDPVLNAGLSGPEAVKAMKVPAGFKVTLAASEPDIVRPIAMTTDDRGRLWVVEANTYPTPAPEGEGKDRIYIFEDTDGDGTLDSKKLFTDGLNLVSGFEVGFGGVWVGAAPYFMFIPMEEGADKPSGPPQILLDGWGTEDTHETLNSFTWGPDGWLYGNHGVFTHSNVGKPGATDAERTRLNASVWRYHPTRHEFEVFAEGGSNQWGLDYNDEGHFFITACVIPHLYHVIQGGRYFRQGGKHFNPYIYDDITTHADHVHWVGERGPHAGNNRSDLKGGGHAHAGAMFYLGGSWPAEYRNQLFMNNIHGNRTNVDVMERQGSGYVGHHGDDFLLTNDTWSQWLNLQYGPDGSVYAIDWYDKNQCHSSNPDVHDKTLGRIFKITHENDRFVRVDLRKMSNDELVAQMLNKNDWYVRHARRILQERGPNPQVHAGLKKILDGNTDVTRRLRALWALHVTKGLSDQDMVKLLSDKDEAVRSWAIQLMAEDRTLPNGALTKMASMAKTDASALVRLYLASAMQRIEPAQRWGVLEGLMAHAEDAGDHNLPLLVWYAAEPMATVDLNRALDLAMASRLPKQLDFTVRRVAAMDSPEAVQALARHLEKAQDKEQQQFILKGLNELVGGSD
ncbi:MAG: plastocyanin/azurin family copper-binding protein [Rhodothermales bacterium]